MGVGCLVGLLGVLTISWLDQGNKLAAQTNRLPIAMALAQAVEKQHQANEVSKQLAASEKAAVADLPVDNTPPLPLPPPLPEVQEKRTDAPTTSEHGKHEKASPEQALPPVVKTNRESAKPPVNDVPAPLPPPGVDSPVVAAPPSEPIVTAPPLPTPAPNVPTPPIGGVVTAPLPPIGEVGPPPPPVTATPVSLPHPVPPAAGEVAPGTPWRDSGAKPELLPPPLPVSDSLPPPPNDLKPVPQGSKESISDNRHDKHDHLPAPPSGPLPVIQASFPPPMPVPTSPPIPVPPNPPMAEPAAVDPLTGPTPKPPMAAFPVVLPPPAPVAVPIHAPPSPAELPPLEPVAKPSIEPPLAPVPGPVVSYQVRAGGETMREIARQTLGGEDHWQDVHRLNPSLQPDQVITAGLTIKLPADACIHSDDVLQPLPTMHPKAAPHKAKAALPLTGTYAINLDDKKALLLPRAIRDQLGNCETVLLSPGSDQCLWLTNQTHLDRLADRLEHSPAREIDVRTFKRLYFAQTEKATVADDGRVMVPDKLARFAGLHQEIMLIGIDDHFEVWDAARWRQYTQQKSAAARAAMAERD
jgi:division/cell wall cluster transcriptional repressor MraZ